MTTLTDFLIELASDPEKARNFKNNPNAEMENAGLSDEDRNLLLSGDPQAIREAIDQEKIGDQIVTIVIISVLLNGGK